MTTAITIKAFRGETPLVAPRLIQNEASTDAFNCKLIDGNLASFYQPDVVANTYSTTPAFPTTIYKHRTSWLKYSTDVDVVKSPSDYNASDLLCVADGTQPRLVGRKGGPVSFGEVDPEPLGIAPPTAKPTIASVDLRESIDSCTVISMMKMVNQGIDGEGNPTPGTPEYKHDITITKNNHGYKTGVKLKITWPEYEILEKVYTVRRVDENQFTLDEWATRAKTQDLNHGTSYDLVWTDSYTIDNDVNLFAFEIEGTSDLELDSRYYCYTYVTEWGGESAPSPLSEMLEVQPYAKVTVEMTTPNLSVNVDRIRLYRTNTGNNGAVFQLVSEIAITVNVATTTVQHQEMLGSDALGAALESENWVEPHTNIRGFVNLPNGVIAGFVGREIMFSEPYVPYAWPVEYRKRLDDDIVALGVAGNTLVVATKGKPYVIGGSHPNSMSVTRLEATESCVTKQSMVDMGDYVMYASPNGLVGIAGNGEVILLTDKVFSKEQWLAMKPEEIVASSYKGLYVAVVSVKDSNEVWRKHFLVFDPKNRDVSYVEYENDLTVSGMYRDLDTDEMYYALQHEIYKFNSLETPTRKTFRWVSKEFQTPSVSYAWAKVEATDYTSVVFKLYRDGTLFHTKTVLDNRPFRLPPGYGTDWQIELTGTSTIESVSVATSMDQL